MGTRYLVSGVELGELIALISISSDEANKKINEIIEEQFIWTSDKLLKDDIILMRKVIEK